MIVGLTGGIGSGKSSAAKFFIELGIDVIDADEVSKNILDSSDYSMLQPGPSSSGLSGMVVLTKYDIPRIGVTNQAIETILTIGG